MERVVIWVIIAIMLLVLQWQMDVSFKKYRLRIRITAFFDTLLLCGFPLELWRVMIQQRRVVERIFGKLSRKELDFLFKVCEARQSNGGEPLEPLFSVYMKKLKARFKR
jgi:hypothetical protein